MLNSVLVGYVSQGGDVFVVVGTAVELVVEVVVVAVKLRHCESFAWHAFHRGDPGFISLM